ncbi:MAG TPA: BatD family protein [Opitutaceae bacterium]|nr:BatD family protein [Opitutaceae bacterium]
MMRRFTFLLPAFLSFVLASIVSAQSVHWEPSSGSLGLGATTELALIFDGCTPDGAVATPTVPGLALESAGSSTSMQLINGSFSRSVTLTYAARASKRGTLTIPAFNVKTDKGNIRVAPAQFEVGEATVGGATSLTSLTSATVQPQTGTHWVGQVFPLTYQMSVSRRYLHSLAGNLEWNATPLTLEEWSRPEPSETLVNGEPRMLFTQRTRAYSRSAGSFSLPPGTQLVNLITGSSGVGFFAQRSVDQFTVSTNKPEYTFKPLPSPAPPEFYKAVGDFTLTAKAIPTSVSVGEPITWTVELSGSGNWPDNPGLPPREVSKDFQVISPPPKRTLKENTLFDGSLAEDVVLVPSKPGTYTLGPIRYAYFDPKGGGYRTVTADAVTVTVNSAPTSAGASNPFANAVLGSTASPSTPVGPVAAARAPVPETPPSLLPKDPLSDTVRGLVPLATATLTPILIAPWVLFVAFWIWLAARRSPSTDPLLPRRRARGAMEAAIASIQSNSAPTVLRNQLMVWQHATASFWNLHKATPNADQLGGAVEKASNRSAASTWTQLWREADRVLYGKDTTLPSDWVTRASVAVTAAPLRKLSWFSVFSPRNLFPFFVLALILLPLSMRADAGIDAYRKGDFAGAEKAWQQAVTASPTDAHARYNLSLALAQQDRWAEAAAEATSAFCLRPGDPAIRWQFNLALERAGIAHPRLSALAHGNNFYAVARICSPGEWLAIEAFSVALIALAFGLILWTSYRPFPTYLRLTANLLGVVALIAGFTAFISLRHYGPAAKPTAVVVQQPTQLRSVPTEADSTQKTEPLPAGTLATVNRTFLGWSQLAFPNGQTGWVRTEILVKLYQ